MRMFFAFATLLLWATSVFAEPNDLAQKFGKRESVGSISLSPDGKRVAYIESSVGRSNIVYVVGLSGGETPKAILTSDGKPTRLRWCRWASNTRLVCQLYGITNDAGTLLPYTRLVALNADGSAQKALGNRTNHRSLGTAQFDGHIVGWPANDNGEVLMARTYVPEFTTGTKLASDEAGRGVDRINTLTLKSSKEEAPRPNVADYITDTSGTIRIMSTYGQRSDGTQTGSYRYYYRRQGEREWRFLSEGNLKVDGFIPVAVDSRENVAFGFEKRDGRWALYKIKLDEGLFKTLVLAHDRVDIENVLTLGGSGRVIGATTVTERREAALFDPEYKALAERLHKVLPGLPLIHFVDASRDEKTLLIFAGSDSDPGRYFAYNKTTKGLTEIMLARPELEGMKLASVKAISYPAADGTLIPAYLTLPPDSSGKGLPAIVMPHGGPSARDEWGFDWLAQYFAAQGYAVLQPNYRGSSGYGDQWYRDNGFKSWRVAIGDVNDAGRWLAAQGIADKSRLAILGWSYGGYAALQSAVLDPDLFKAIIAIAPVTDLRMLISQARAYTSSAIVADFVGSGEHLISGSPLQQVARIKAPVLLISGDLDVNVEMRHAKAMDAALRAAGKDSQFVLFQGLDHLLEDSEARADMLDRSTAFLRKTLKLK